MPSVDLICLANSYKWHSRCLAGLRVDGGGWVRPVSDREHGELQYSQYRLPDHSEPHLFDVIRVGLSHRQPTPHQPENWLVNNSAWALLERPASVDHVHVVSAAGASGFGGPCARSLRCGAPRVSTLLEYGAVGAASAVPQPPGAGVTRARAAHRYSMAHRIQHL